MFGKAKNWHSGLSKASKVILWSVTAVLAGTGINAAANPSSHTVNPTPPSVQAKSKEPVTEKKTLAETSAIAFDKTNVNDGNLEKGKTEIRTVGVNGVKTQTYEVTFVDGKETGRKLIKDEVTTAPVSEVTAIGTYVAPPKPKTNCDANYSGCVPVASDVDCSNGSGNGPVYVSGPVYVLGSDIYGLDRDGDGVGCE